MQWWAWLLLVLPFLPLLTLLLFAVTLWRSQVTSSTTKGG